MAQREGVCSMTWQQGLASCRNPALFFWRALSFQQYTIAGLLIWFLVHMSLWILLSQGASVLYVTGNFLLLTSLAIVLCSVVASYGNLADTEWTERDEQAFNELCTRLTEFEHTLRVLWNMAVRYRQTKPLKFYACGVILAGFVITLDQLVSAAIVLQCAVCCVLLLPLWLHKGLLPSMSDADVDHLMNVLQHRVGLWSRALAARGKQMLQ